MKLKNSYFQIILALFVATGMFYPFLSIGCSAYLAGYLVWFLRKKKQPLVLNAIDVALIALVACYFLSVIWAVDRGMAWIGAGKWLALLLFSLVFKQWESEQQTSFIHLLPWVAAGTVLLSAVLFFTPAKDAFFIAGRLAGSFGYANSYAMFLLIAVGILFSKDHLFDKKTIALLAVLLAGILWTASRTVGILTLVFLAYEIGKMLFAGKNASCRRLLSYRRRNIVACLGIRLVLAIGGVIPGVRGLYARMMDLSLHSSTFLGRLLYAQDAVGLIRMFPFGLGANGYGYVNGLAATGLYDIKYVHQALLQLILDIGIAPAVLFLVLFLYGIKKAKVPENPYVLILILAVLHAMFDIDMEYVSLPVILIILLQSKSGKEDRNLSPRSSGICAIILGAVAVLQLPVMFANVCYLAGNYDGALALCPFYSDARELRMECSEDIDEIVQDAYTLVKNNRYSAKGCQMLGALAYLDGDYEQMEQYLDRELELVPYQNDEYEMYEQFLQDLIDQNPDQQTVSDCKKKISELQDLKEQKLAEMSSLGKQIADQPDFQ